MDNEFLEAAVLIAETPITSETPGVHPDHFVDELIFVARTFVRNNKKEYAENKIPVNL